MPYALMPKALHISFIVTLYRTLSAQARALPKEIPNRGASIIRIGLLLRAEK